MKKEEKRIRNAFVARTTLDDDFHVCSHLPFKNCSRNFFMLVVTYVTHTHLIIHPLKTFFLSKTHYYRTSIHKRLDDVHRSTQMYVKIRRKGIATHDKRVFEN